MRSEFRFPKSTPVLMMIILAGIVLALEKARVIQASFSNGNPPVVPDGGIASDLFPDARAPDGNFLRRRTRRLGHSFCTTSVRRSPLGRSSGISQK